MKELNKVWLEYLISEKELHIPVTTIILRLRANDVECLAGYVNHKQYIAFKSVTEKEKAVRLCKKWEAETMEFERQIQIKRAWEKEFEQ